MAPSCRSADLCSDAPFGRHCEWRVDSLEAMKKILHPAQRAVASDNWPQPRWASRPWLACIWALLAELGYTTSWVCGTTAQMTKPAGRPCPICRQHQHTQQWPSLGRRMPLTWTAGGAKSTHAWTTRTTYTQNACMHSYVHHCPPMQHSPRCRTPVSSPPIDALRQSEFASRRR